MYSHVPPQLWMQLDSKIRAELVSAFNIQRTGITEIRDQVLISDGYSVEDLKVLTLEKMNEYIGSQEETVARAWEITCAKAKSVVYPPIAMEIPPTVVPMADEPKEEIIENNTKTNGSTKKSK